jgi:hypothetical protein
VSRIAPFVGPYFPKVFLVLLALLVPTGAAAGSQEEIVHLLQYIEKSECVFTRNGEEHLGAEAQEHIQMKYDYVRKKVETTEDFIKYAATKSSLSGKPYLVRCKELEILTADWLKAELDRFRQPETEIAPRNRENTP